MAVTADYLCQYVAGNQLKAELELITALGSGTDSQIPTAAAVETAISGSSHNPVTIAAGSAAALSLSTQELSIEAGLNAIAGLVKTDGNIIVGNGSTWVAESGATARASLGLGSIATQAAGSVNIDGGAIDGTTIGAASAAAGTFSALTDSALTSGRVTYATSGGLLTDSANLTFDGTTLTAHTLTVSTGKLTMPAAGEIEAATSLELDSPLVGIGGTPSEKMEIFNDASWQLALTNTGVGGAKWYVGSSNNGWSSDGGKFIISYNTLSSSAALAIASDGNVGINTTGPDRKLDVLDASNPQIRYTHTDGSVYGEIQADSSGYTIFTTTGALFNLNGNTVLGGTSIGTSATMTLGLNTGTAPGSSPADMFQMYSADQAAGNACPHFRCENGNVVKLYQETALTSQLTTITHTAPGTSDYAIQTLTNSGGYAFVTADEGHTVLAVIANLQARVAELETRLQAHGLLA